MTTKNTKVVIALADLEKRINLKKLLFADEMIELVGEVTKSEDCRKAIKEHGPEVVIVGQSLEDGSGLELIAALTVESPDLSCILYLESELADEAQRTSMMREAMVVGARDCLMLPIVPDVTLRMIKRVGEITKKKREVLAAMSGATGGPAHTCRTTTVFSTKGGVGRSIVSVNLACALAKGTGKKVALMDLNLQFGDIAIMMDIKPTRTISTLVQEADASGELDEKVVSKYLITHEPTGIDILPAPLKPEDSELITGEHIGKVMRVLAEKYHYLVIDTPSNLNDVLLTALDQSDLILLLLTLELPTIKSGKLMLEVMESLKFPKDKIRIIMNRDNPKAGINTKEVEEALKYPIAAVIPSDGKTVLPTINTGKPFYLTQPALPISKALMNVAKLIAGDDFKEGGVVPAAAAGAEGAAAAPAKPGFLAGLFGGKKK